MSVTETFAYFLLLIAACLGFSAVVFVLAIAVEALNRRQAERSGEAATTPATPSG